MLVEYSQTVCHSVPNNKNTRIYDNSIYKKEALVQVYI